MNDIPETRQTLILRLRHSDDAEAWSEFIEIYEPLILRLARNKGLQSADAMDLTQNVLTRVATAINRFEADPKRGTFRGWISRITRNLVVDFLRRKNRIPQTCDDSAILSMIEQVPDPGSETDLFDIEHERQMFQWAAEKIQHSFKPNTWKAFWLTTVEQVKPDDVAARLSISRGAVYIARSRVMARLKETIERTQFESRVWSPMNSSPSSPENGGTSNEA